MSAKLCTRAVFLLLASRVRANTEKTIFQAPQPPSSSVADLASLCLPVLLPEQPSLRTQLSLRPIGDELADRRTSSSWYLLHQLNAGRRYEARVCWAANVCAQTPSGGPRAMLPMLHRTAAHFGHRANVRFTQQPSEFWLDALTISEAFESATLIADLATFAEHQHETTCPELPGLNERQSALLLRVRAAANFYSANRTLMLDPPAVVVDVILDPYLANALPRSLAATAAFVVAAALGAWFLSGMIWQKLRLAAHVGSSKPHFD